MSIVRLFETDFLFLSISDAHAKSQILQFYQKIDWAFFRTSVEKYSFFSSFIYFLYLPHRGDDFLGFPV